jgi:hypothetical protein
MNYKIAPAEAASIDRGGVSIQVSRPIRSRGAESPAPPHFAAMMLFQSVLRAP